MWAVSQAFLDAIVVPHGIATTVTATAPGGSPVTLPLVAGSVQVDGTQLIRRQAQNITVDGGTATYDLLSTPGTRVSISHGVIWSYQSPELVPVFSGELTDAVKTLGDGQIVFNAADLWQKVVAADYTAVYEPSPTATRVAEITSQVQAAVPGTAVSNTSGDTSTVFTTQTWTSRADYISGLAADAGLEVFFGPDGTFHIRKEAAPTDTPVWTIHPDTGTGGNLIGLVRTRPLDKIINYVTVVPGNAGGTQTWTPQVAQVTTTTHPRYPGKIGVRPYTYTDNTSQTAAQALATAQALLGRALGSTDTLSLDALSNPALEAGDVITVIDLTDTGYVTAAHLVSSLTLDLVTGGMTVTTRSDSEALP